MQVYKCFLRILKKSRSQVILYLVIFVTLSVILSTQGQESAEIQFEAESYKFSVFDEDDTGISKSIGSFLEKNNEKVEIEDTKETIQDELYNRNTNCVIRIPKGFSAAVEAGEAQQLLELTTIPGTVYRQMFSQSVEGYVRILNSYMAGGFSEEEAIEKAMAASEEEAEVEIIGRGGGMSHTRIYYFFSFVPYIMLCLCVMSIAFILIVFRGREVQLRIDSSPYSRLRMNGELLAGCLTTGLVFYLIILLVVLVFNGTELFTVRGALFSINMLCFLLIALGLVFMISQLTKNKESLNMIANVLGLGFSFLGGVFVPLDLLGDGMIKLAHYIPSYWYVRAVNEIDHFSAGDSIGKLAEFWGIQLLFGVAFLAIGLACLKRRAD